MPLYVDGHECDNVVKYCQSVFLLAWNELQSQMHTWDKDSNEEDLNLPSGVKPLILWHHNETVYYAHDRYESQWVQADASPAPYAKGEGPSIMDVDYMSPNYGFCRSPNGTETSCVIFKPGKA